MRTVSVVHPYCAKLSRIYSIIASSYPPASSSTGKAAPAPPHLAANLLSTLELLTTMPTAPSELNEWWCSPPLVFKSSAAGPPSRKRKQPPSTKVDDGSTGVFDSSSEEEEEEVKKLSSKDSKRLLPPLKSLSAHKRVFQDCWLALLSLPLDESEAKRVLVILHRQVLPHMTDPKRVMDWLVDSADAGALFLPPHLDEPR